MDIVHQVHLAGGDRWARIAPLDEDPPLSAQCLAAVSWTQTAGPTVSQSELTTDPVTGKLTFTAPGVTTTTTLSFGLSISTCSGLANGGTGSASVPVQVASVTFDLPATIPVGGSVDLMAGTVTVITGAPADVQPLFFALEPVPQGVSIGLTTSMLMVDGTGVPGQTINITVFVLASAGFLTEAVDSIQIVAP